jgi:hypothetical protein
MFFHQSNTGPRKLRPRPRFRPTLFRRRRGRWPTILIGVLRPHRNVANEAAEVAGLGHRALRFAGPHLSIPSWQSGPELAKCGLPGEWIVIIDQGRCSSSVRPGVCACTRSSAIDIGRRVFRGRLWLAGNPSRSLCQPGERVSKWLSDGRLEAELRSIPAPGCYGTNTQITRT